MVQQVKTSGAKLDDLEFNSWDLQGSGNERTNSQNCSLTSNVYTHTHTKCQGVKEQDHVKSDPVGCKGL